MALPEGFRRDVETYTNAVYSSWPDFCRRARIGFAEKQRGAFLIDLDQPLAPPDDVLYVTTDEASKAMGLEDVSAIAILSRVGTYNPEREIVVTFRSIAHSQAQCVVLREPPSEYRVLPPKLFDRNCPRMIDRKLR